MPVLCAWGEMVKVTEDFGRKIGVDISSRTVHRLVCSGLVRGRYLSPKTCLVDLESFWAHLKAAEDPQYWSEERMEQYREGCRTYDARARGVFNLDKSDDQ
jgi:hypothetical protein